MKRKADSESDLHNGLFLKSLKRSVSDFICENDAGLAVLSEKKKLGQDPADECWSSYRKRLGTFDVITRSKLPKEISPSVCASHGWLYTGNDFLHCEECKKFLCISIPSLLSSSMSVRVMQSCVKNIQRKLNESHDLTCSWRTNSGLDLCHPYNIFDRYKMFVDSKTNVSALPESLLKDKTFSNFNEFENRFFMFCAIYGWIPSTRKDLSRIECLLCGRDASLLVFGEEMPFHPLNEHYSYCPVSNKEFPLWQESINQITKFRQKEPVLLHLSRVKAMLSNIFGK